jgi:hypothetical protein
MAVAAETNQLFMQIAIDRARRHFRKRPSTDDTQRYLQHGRGHHQPCSWSSESSRNTDDAMTVVDTK